MARDLRLALDDMLTAISRIEDATRGMEFEQFCANWKAQYIVERGLMIVSEASRAIPQDLKEKYPHVRWIGVRDIGNVLRHQYATLSPSLLWNVVKDELPQLSTVVAAMIPLTKEERS